MSQNIENQRVKELRGHMSLKEFATPLGVTPVTISKIETGENGLSSEMAKKICKVYNVSMSWLFGETDERMPVAKEEQLPDIKLMQENAELQKRLIELQDRLLNKQTAELESLKNGESFVAK